MITMNTQVFFFRTSIRCKCCQAKTAKQVGGIAAQVSLLTLIVGNLDEKSFALAAILTATWRATAL